MNKKRFTKLITILITLIFINTFSVQVVYAVEDLDKLQVIDVELILNDNKPLEVNGEYEGKLLLSLKNGSKKECKVTKLNSTNEEIIKIKEENIAKTLKKGKVILSTEYEKNIYKKEIEVVQSNTKKSEESNNINNGPRDLNIEKNTLLEAEETVQEDKPQIEDILKKYEGKSIELVVNFNAERIEEGIKITWDEAPLNKVIINRKEEELDYVKLVEITEGTNYIDKDVSEEKGYTYKLEFIQESGKAQESTELKIEPKNKKPTIEEENNQGIKEDLAIDKDGNVEIDINKPFFVKQENIDKFKGQFKLKYKEDKEFTGKYENIEIFRYNEANLLMKDVQISKESVDVGYIAYSGDIENKLIGKGGETVSAFGVGLDGLAINLDNLLNDSSVEYRTHTKENEWNVWCGNGVVSGNVGENKYINAFEVKLKGAPEEQVVEYRAYMSETGWQTWKSNGETAGDINSDEKIEAIELKIYNKKKSFINDYESKLFTVEINEPGKYVIKDRDEAKPEIVDGTDIIDGSNITSDDIIPGTEKNVEETNNKIQVRMPIPPAGGMPITGPLYPGGSGYDVELLQSNLLALGFNLGGSGVTGYYGDYTRAAIMALQKVYWPDSPNMWVGECGPSTTYLINNNGFTSAHKAKFPKQEEIEQQYIELNPGSDGKSVKLLQQNLLKLGFDLGGYGATGYFGNYTVAALKAIQLENGLTISQSNGRYGPSSIERVQYFVNNLSTYNSKYKTNVMNKYKIALTLVELDPGQQGTLVQSLQNNLKTLGFDLGGYGATGYYGTYTQMALLSIQNVYGNGGANGRYGPWTMEKVHEYLDEIGRTGTYKDKSKVMAEYERLLRNVELDPGNEGTAVKILQQRLERLGFSMAPYGCTGYYGNYTKAAILSIQKNSGLDLVGRFGPGTRAQLEKMEAEFSKTGTFTNRAQMLRDYENYKYGDTNINVSGRYGREVKYFAQTDPGWSSIQYKPCSNIGRAGCGPTSMAMVVSTLTNSYKSPVDLCKLSQQKGQVVEGGTLDSFFGIASKEYGINYKHYSDMQINDVKRELATGNKLAIAWMKPGHFTKAGHYVVITGVETINGENYFTIYDPNAPNPNFDRYNDNAIIQYKNDSKSVIVKSKTKVFASESISYHVFDKGENIKPLPPVSGDEVPNGGSESAGSIILNGFESGVAWAYEEDTPYKAGDQALIIASNGNPHMADVYKAREKVTGKVGLVFVPQKGSGYYTDNAQAAEWATAISFLIDFTVLDTGKDVLDFLAGKDIITGEEINRFILFGNIVTPSILEGAFKIGAKNADEIANYVKKETKICNDGFCFTGETLVRTDNGLKRIDSIKSGDSVLSKNIDTGKIEYKPVIYVYENTVSEILKVKTSNEVIDATPNHPFKLYNGEWINARDIKIGDKIENSNGSFNTIESIETIVSENLIKTYNLEVLDNDTYYVSNLELLVHNGCKVDFASVLKKVKGFTEQELESLGKTLNSNINYSGYAYKKLMNGVAEGIYKMDKVTYNGKDAYKVLSDTGTQIIFDTAGKTKQVSYRVGSMADRGSGHQSAVVPKVTSGEKYEKGHIRSVQDGADKKNPIDDSPLNIIPQRQGINRSAIKKFENWRADKCRGEEVIHQVLDNGYVNIKMPGKNIDVTYNPNANNSINWEDEWWLKGSKIWGE